jgi:hypothetical protein
VPPELDGIVLKAVAPNPDSRYQSAATLAAELRSVAAILDVRGATDDDEDEEPNLVNVGGVVVMTVVILGAIAAVAWWFLR